MARSCVFVDALMMHFITVILQIFRQKSWFGLAANYLKKCAMQGFEFLKMFIPVQTVMVPPGESNIIKLLYFPFYLH